jgi:DNA-binding MarR family transcriptional regulator
MNERNSPPPTLEKSHQEGDVHLLREVMRTHQAMLAVFSREVGIPASRLALMRLLAVASPERLGIMEIARHLGVNAAAVTRQVQELEKERLVVRRADPKDKRRVGVQLSANGHKIFERLHERSHKLERSLVATISPEEMRIAAKVLESVRGVLDALR